MGTRMTGNPGIGDPPDNVKNETASTFGRECPPATPTWGTRSETCNQCVVKLVS